MFQADRHENDSRRSGRQRKAASRNENGLRESPGLYSHPAASGRWQNQAVGGQAREGAREDQENGHSYVAKETKKSTHTKKLIYCLLLFFFVPHSFGILFAKLQGC